MTTLKHIALVLCLLASIGGLWGQSSRLSQYVATCPLVSEEVRTQTASRLDSLVAQGADPQATQIATSEVSSITIALLPMLNGTPLIVVIDKVLEPVADSHIRYFSPEWVELAEVSLVKGWPTREEVLARLDATDGTSAEIRLGQLLYPLYIDASLSQRELHLRPVLPLTKSDREDVALMTLADRLPTFVYRWDGNAFVRTN